MANKRLIDANAIEYIEHTECHGHGLYFSEKIVHKDDIDKMPTIDAVEVVHAEWTTILGDDWTMETIYQCSACKEEFVTIDGTPAENLWNYCPNCGAKMDGGNEDDKLQ